MKIILTILLFFAFSYATDETKRMNLINIPFKEASMLEGYSSFMNVDIHTKTINENEQESYFDEDLTSDNIYAVLARITNNSQEKVLVYTMDARLNNDVLALNLQTIIEPYQKNVAAKGALWGTIGNVISFGMRVASGADDKEAAEAQAYMEEIRNEFYKKSLKETLLYPGDTTSGFIFFDKNKISDNNNFSVQMQFMNSLQRYTLESSILK
ncbi:MAG: hypothetical protein ACNI28_01395 [Arcobacter sp.]|uniref:hypothetical protein n=1 Tax=Arcobacter sp. TaxID=1872629 RepID=UPI003AFFB706